MIWEAKNKVTAKIYKQMLFHTGGLIYHPTGRPGWPLWGLVRSIISQYASNTQAEVWRRCQVSQRFPWRATECGLRSKDGKGTQLLTQSNSAMTVTAITSLSSKWVHTSLTTNVLYISCSFLVKVMDVGVWRRNSPGDDCGDVGPARLFTRELQVQKTTGKSLTVTVVVLIHGAFNQM